MYLTLDNQRMALINKLRLKNALISTTLSCVMLVILSIAFFNIRFFNPLQKAFKDFSFLDVYFSQKFEENSNINKDIILVNIENHSREVIAYLLESVINSDPKVVGLDVIFKTHKTHDQTDSLLRKLLQNKKIITSSELRNGELVVNDSFFKTNSEPGFVNFNFEEENNVIRDFIGIENINGKKTYSFASKVVKSYLSSKEWDALNYDTKLNHLQFINYYGSLDKFPILTLNDFILGEKKDFLKDKIVLLGYLGDSKMDNSTDITDKFWTPLNNVVAGKSDRDMYGMVIHANIVNMLVNNKLVSRVSFFYLV
jgi:CHASE2 domain-containing sensor protein